MNLKRIIPCLDMADGKVVKGVQFKSFRNAGDPVKTAFDYSKKGADELVFLDITATVDNRNILIDVVRRTAQKVSVPFTVGGGVRKLKDVHDLLLAGADKVSINTGGFLKPELFKQVAKRFGLQSIMAGVDVVEFQNKAWEVMIKGGSQKTGIEVRDWCKKAVNLGAGKILLTSIDRDGTKAGYV